MEDKSSTTSSKDFFSLQSDEEDDLFTVTKLPSALPVKAEKLEAVFIPGTNIFDLSDDDDDNLFTGSLTSKPKAAEIKVTCTKTERKTANSSPLVKKKPVPWLHGLFDNDIVKDGLFGASDFSSGPGSSQLCTSKTSESAKSSKPGLDLLSDASSEEDRLITTKPSAVAKIAPAEARKSSSEGLFGSLSFEDYVMFSFKPKVPVKEPQPQEEDSLFSVVKPRKLKVATAEGLPMRETEISFSHKSDKAVAKPIHYYDLTNLKHQVKQLQIDRNHYDEQFSVVNSKLEKMLAEIQTNNDHLKNQLSLTQQQLLDVQKSNEVLQTNNTYIQNQLALTQRLLLSVQKINEVLQVNYTLIQNELSATQNQLSLTQQQLLGVQSMVTSSRLWVVSHGQFTIGREIGRGAWATVHKSTFRGSIVAAKCLHELINASTTRQLFQREMEIALQCQHHNVVTFLGATLKEPLVILMELMDISLRKAYEQRNIKDRQVLGILRDTASALHFLHTRPDPVIHRDVSSANVLLKAVYNGEWLAKLGDLGTATIQQYITTPGPGALVYAAPEVANPKCHSTKMDVYSFGVLVIEVLTKTLPFQNLRLLKAQVQRQSPQYHQLVTSCTNQQSSDRPSMFEVIRQLNKIKATRS